LVTSDPVLDELRRGDYPSKEAALKMAQELPVLEMAPAIGEIVEAYVRHRLLGLYVPVLATPLELLGENHE